MLKLYDTIKTKEDAKNLPPGTLVGVSRRIGSQWIKTEEGWKSNINPNFPLENGSMVSAQVYYIPESGYVIGKTYKGAELLNVPVGTVVALDADRVVIYVKTDDGLFFKSDPTDNVYSGRLMPYAELRYTIVYLPNES